MDWKQRALYHLMSDISEDHYCAGWMEGNEFALWEMVANPEASRIYGMSEVPAARIEELRAISAEVGGWICWFDDQTDPNLPIHEWGAAFVPMDEWLPKHAAHMELQRKLIARYEPQRSSSQGGA